mmetsp:Transcript_108702/g.307438  ORF Transcript_108702/g.307438 Transcript_108702/m.307438 type:complete len:445 (-) Transcript_108702:203-1537(-)
MQMIQGPCGGCAPTTMKGGMQQRPPFTPAAARKRVPFMPQQPATQTIRPTAHTFGRPPAGAPAGDGGPSQGPAAKKRRFELQAAPSAAKAAPEAPQQLALATGGKGKAARGGVKLELDSEGVIGEVRFEKDEDASRALAELNGSTVENSPITVEPDEVNAKKIIVRGLPLHIEWQELKDHCATIGAVAFVKVWPPSPGKFGQVVERSQPVPGTSVGEVRYDSTSDARQAMLLLDGTNLHGYQLSLQMDNSSKDGTKLIVYGLAPGIQWQEIKDHFSQVGTVAFANITGVLPGGGQGAYQGGFDPSFGSPWGVPCFGYGCGFQPAGFAKGSPGKGKGKAAKGPSASPTMGGISAVGEIRFEHAESVVAAVANLSGTNLGGSEIHVEEDPRSMDKSKCIVYGLPPSIEWQELKDHFAQVGPVAFANILSAQSAVAASAAMEGRHAL